MSAVKFCRFCLITGTKMETISEREIECFIDPSEVYPPILACYECSAIIRKIDKFFNKFSSARNILEIILETEDHVSEETLKTYDRKLLQMHSSLECCENPLIISCFTIPEAYLPVQENNSQEAKKYGTNRTIEKAIFNANGVFDNDNDDNNTFSLKKFEIDEVVLVEVRDEKKQTKTDDENSNDSNSIDMDNILKNYQNDDNGYTIQLNRDLNEVELVEVRNEKKQRRIDDDDESNVSNSIGMDSVLKNYQNDDNGDTIQMKTDFNEVDSENYDLSFDFGKVLKDIEYNTEGNGLNQIMKKRRKTKVPMSTKKGPQPKFHLLEYLFEITELTRSEQIKEFAKRKESVYYLKNKYKCELCVRGFNQRTTYETHVKLYHDPGIGGLSKCPVCNIIKKNSVELNKHIYNYHKHLYKCKRCDFISTVRTTVDKHRRWHEGAVYSCKVCGESFDNMMSQLGHQRAKHPSEFLCDLCGLPFISTHGIRAHKRMAHFDHKESTEASDPQLYCEECKIQFATSNAWQTHLQHSIKHNPHKLTTGAPTPRPWKPVCRFCGDKFKNREELRIHHLAQHRKRPRTPRTSRPRGPTTPRLQEYPTQCDHCELVLTSNEHHYRHHQNLHSDKRYKRANFVCDMCGALLLNRNSLNLHIRSVHSQPETQLVCDYCHMKFSSIVYLKAHIKRHLYPTHLCSSCGKVLKSRSNLMVHIRNVHGGPRPHECILCQKTFIMASMLKVHVNDVHLGLAKKRIRTKKKANS